MLAGDPIDFKDNQDFSITSFQIIDHTLIFRSVVIFTGITSISVNLRQLPVLRCGISPDIAGSPDLDNPYGTISNVGAYTVPILIPIDIVDVPVTGYTGDVWIVAKYWDDADEWLSMATDSDIPAGYSYYSMISDPPDWQQVTDRNYMMRINIEYEPCVTAGYAYFPGDANMFFGIWPPQCIGGDVTYLVNYFRGVGDPPVCCYWGCGMLYFALQDHLGSTRVIVDSTGQMYDTYDYYATGDKTDLTQVHLGTDYQFLTKEFDEEAGFNLNYLGARYFDSKMFQFNSVEPLLVGPKAGGNFKSVNYGLYFGTPYTYSLNNPVKFVDRDGNVVETVADIACVGLSAYDLYKEPSWANAGWLAADIGGALIPFVPSAGVFRHGSKIGAKLLGKVDNIRAVGNTVEVTKRGTRNIELAGKVHPKTKVPFNKKGFPNFKKIYIKVGQMM